MLVTDFLLPRIKASRAQSVPACHPAQLSILWDGVAGAGSRECSHLAACNPASRQEML